MSGEMITGNVMNLQSGRVIDPLDLRPDDVNPQDAIHALSMLNRYGGHTRLPYSVAEHTVHLVRKVPFHLRRAALIHDWSEAFGFVDVVRPVKHRLPEYCGLETAAQRRIFQIYSVAWEDMEELHEWDKRICQDEMMQVFDYPSDCGMQPLGVQIEFWGWERAKVELTYEARRLGVVK